MRRWRNQITRGTGKQKIQLKWQKQKGALCWVKASRTSDFTRHHDFEENLREWERQRSQGTRNGKDEPHSG